MNGRDAGCGKISDGPEGGMVNAGSRGRSA